MSPEKLSPEAVAGPGRLTQWQGMDGKISESFKKSGVKTPSSLTAVRQRRPPFVLQFSSTTLWIPFLCKSTEIRKPVEIFSSFTEHLIDQSYMPGPFWDSCLTH